ncbi:putative metalloprotease with PDZ domain [Algoriphagus zhangzhouensis]|uniref:Predicted metalloprotease, contains C-terminal PDZ domain n=2 Tax=Algoriphagus zhangzhouensis TaxID=1073327 RepID=A0A1M7ZD16_9BACT|nr:putative metalloprotease with PDZ domain [Algoriphagus zhangzhouensis]SHO62795.1 Predicted metalloprotease, contains C-terminal PDZ domain [Algoriphagus zhangzhouensis]
MSRIILLFSFVFSITTLNAQQKISYLLNKKEDTNKVTIQITFDALPASDANLVIPRSAPGTYILTNYIAFVDDVVGYTTTGKQLQGMIGDGSFFTFGESNEPLNKVSYTVDIEKMEIDLLDASTSSKAREDYMGLFGYSVFGFIEGMEAEAINLRINTDPSWPIFSTLRPDTNRNFGTDTYEVENYAALVDAQYLLGKGVQVIRVEEAQIPLFVAAYGETTIDLEGIGNQGLLSLQKLGDYFGYIPMPHYTLVYEFLKPLSERHDYGFNMEHLNSMTAHRDISEEYNPNRGLGTIIHHMGHSWIPLRSWGEGYRPFSWQVAPLVETIWLNEGFIWYVSFQQILSDEARLNWWKSNMDNAPDFIKTKTLKELSLLGSTQYASDFRIGKNLFSRGALMAYDLDEYIQKQTNGKKSFKDAILGLLNWSKDNQRAFKYNEIEPIMSKATSVDLKPIWNKWQNPPE